MLRTATVTGCLLLILAIVFLTQVTRPPDAITGWRIAILFVLFGLLLVGIDLWDREGVETWFPMAAVLLAGAVLIEGVYRYRVPAFGPNGPHPILLVLVLVALVTFISAYPDPRDRSPAEWLALSGFVLVAGLFFYHATGTAAPTWPLWATVVAGVSIFVIPRFLDESLFLWSLAGLSALTAVIGIVSVVSGEFSIVFADVERWSQSVPFVGVEIDSWYGHTSIFNNVNVFGLVTFAGVSAAVFLFHRSWHMDSFPIAFLSSLFLILNGVGLLLSNSGAAWIAATITVGTYGVYVLFGRWAIVPTFLLGISVAAGLIWIAFVGVVGIEDSGRFDRWESAIQAFRDSPSLLGHGHISTPEFTAEYVDGDPDEPHNSYLDMLIRIGPIGLLAYVVLLFGGLLGGVLRYESVNVGMFALTLGWAFHHLFESYTMIQWTIPAVLSALALGYLVVGDSSIGESADTEHPDRIP